MSVYKHEKSPFYHYDFQHKGRRFHGSTRETALAAAKRIEAEERQKAIAEAAIEAREIARGERPTGPMTLIATVERYWSEIARARCDPTRCYGRSTG